MDFDTWYNQLVNELRSLGITGEIDLDRARGLFAQDYTPVDGANAMYATQPKPGNTNTQPHSATSRRASGAGINYFFWGVILLVLYAYVHTKGGGFHIRWPF